MTPLPAPAHDAIAPGAADLRDLFLLKYGNPRSTGWGPRLRWSFDYYTPDDHYEALVDRLVTPTSRWLDVGCGRHLLPDNAKLARTLASRCRLLVGVDPSSTIEENPFVHERIRGSLEDYHEQTPFDIVTLRMVAEHIANPEQLVSRLSELTSPGGNVVVYTVNRWSPVPVITRFTPFSLHHPVKRLLWRTEERDTYPVVYAMNTRSTLSGLFAAGGFVERHFAYLDDCRTFGRFRAGLRAELLSRRLLAGVGLRYPETCLLAVYVRT